MINSTPEKLSGSVGAGSGIISLIAAIIIAGFLIMPCLAMASIAKISSFKGDVVVQSGGNVYRVGETGHPVNNGDIVLTKEGEVQITFRDGGVLQIKPYSQIQVQERKEQKGLLFKRTEVARRITCFLGKLWFKSGAASDTRHYLQSPTAVAGVRGSDGDFGFNPANMQTFLNMYSGEASVVGNVIRGFFDNPGISAAQKSQVYQNLVQAYNKTQQALATGKTMDQAQAKVDALKVAKEAAGILVQNNPDATVKQVAQLANAAVDASIAAASATVSLEKVKEDRQAAEDAAKKEADPAKKKLAEEAAKKAAQQESRAAAAARAAAIASEQAKKAADAPQPNLNQVQQAAQQATQAATVAQQALQQTENIVSQVVTTTVAPTTIAPTTIAPTTIAPTTMAPTTTATTTIEITIISSTTTSTTSKLTTVSP